MLQLDTINKEFAYNIILFTPCWKILREIRASEILEKTNNNNKVEKWSAPFFSQKIGMHLYYYSRIIRDLLVLSFDIP